MIVDWSPAAAMSRSISAWSTAIGFGCWKKGCGVWCGDERKTTRRAKVARRSTTAGAVVGGAVQTRKTALTPRSPASSDPGTVRWTVTTSTFAGSVAAASERCVKARTGTPASISRSTTARPTRPVAPVTRTGGTRVRVIRTSKSSVAGAWRNNAILVGAEERDQMGCFDGPQRPKDGPLNTPHDLARQLAFGHELLLDHRSSGQDSAFGACS